MGKTWRKQRKQQKQEWDYRSSVSSAKLYQQIQEIEMMGVTNDLTRQLSSGINKGRSFQRICYKPKRAYRSAADDCEKQYLDN